MSANNRQLYSELGHLARYIEQTMHGFQSLQQPIEAASHQLPQATEHLSDLRRMSEEATHLVMGQTEAIQDNTAKMLGTLTRMAERLDSAGLSGPLVEELRSVQQLLGEDDKRLIEIFTALSFQDLLAQKINKLVTVLNEVEHKLLELLVVFGSHGDGGEPRDTGKTGEMLKWLEASKTTALKQDLVDDVLGQLGFG